MGKPDCNERDSPMSNSYPNTQLMIGGQWCDPAAGESLAVFNPATGKEIGRVAKAGKADLDRALAAAADGFAIWRNTTAVSAPS